MGELGVTKEKFYFKVLKGSKICKNNEGEFTDFYTCGYFFVEDGLFKWEREQLLRELEWKIAKQYNIDPQYVVCVGRKEFIEKTGFQGVNVINNKIKLTTVTPYEPYEKQEIYIQLPIPDKLRSIGEVEDERSEPFEIQGDIGSFGPVTVTLINDCYNCKHREGQICKVYSSENIVMQVDQLICGCKSWEDETV